MLVTRLPCPTYLCAILIMYAGNGSYGIQKRWRSNLRIGKGNCRDWNVWNFQ